MEPTMKDVGAVTTFPVQTYYRKSDGCLQTTCCWGIQCPSIIKDLWKSTGSHETESISEPIAALPSWPGTISSPSSSSTCWCSQGSQVPIISAVALWIWRSRRKKQQERWIRMMMTMKCTDDKILCRQVNVQASKNLISEKSFKTLL